MSPVRSVTRLIGLVLLLPAALACRAAEPPLRLAIAGFSHETCTFCPGGDSDVDRWTRLRPPYQGDEIFTADAYVRGFVARAREYGGVELIGLESPADVYGGSSASWSTRDAFEHFLGRILEDLRRNLPVDGVYLALHGAMAVRDVPRPEAEIARRVREIVGPDVPIAATFDLHGNEDGEFLRWADLAFTTKRYPHYDAYEQGERAARMLLRAARGHYRATTATRKPPVITATVLQWTGQSPSMDIMERARRWEAREPDAYVSVFYGFPWADVPDVGAAVMVMTNDDQVLADEIADDMAGYIWRVRERFAGGKFPGPADGVAQVRRAVAAGATPVAVGDHSDRSGDATHILRQVVDQQLGHALIGTIRDEHVLAALADGDARSGDPFAMDVGGFAGPASGSPVRIEGTLLYFDEAWRFDRVAAVAFGDGNLLVITPTLVQVTDPHEFTFVPGVDLADFEVFVVKSRVHFRRGFDETGFARTVLIVDAPGPYLGTLALDALDYQFAPIDKLYPFGTPDPPWR